MRSNIMKDIYFVVHEDDEYKYVLSTLDEAVACIKNRIEFNKMFEYSAKFIIKVYHADEQIGTIEMDNV